LQENKVVNLRYDALGYILNSATLTSESKVLIIENTKGLITSGAVERMGDKGTILKLSFTEKHVVNTHSEVPYMFKMNRVYGNNITWLKYQDLLKKDPINSKIYK
jgi:hypothetical protein